MMRAMCGVQVKDIKRAKDLMLMVGVNELHISWIQQTVFLGMITY